MLLFDLRSSGTRMTLRNRGEPFGFSKVAAPVMASAMRRANRKDLERLKSILEAEPARSVRSRWHGWQALPTCQLPGATRLRSLASAGP